MNIPKRMGAFHLVHVLISHAEDRSVSYSKYDTATSNKIFNTFQRAVFAGAVKKKCTLTLEKLIQFRDERRFSWLPVSLKTRLRHIFQIGNDCNVFARRKIMLSFLNMKLNIWRPKKFLGCLLMIDSEKSLGKCLFLCDAGCKIFRWC